MSSHFAGRLCCAAGLFLWSAASSAGAQATRTVSPLDPVVRDIATLSAAGLIDGAVLSHLPYTQLDVVRWLTEAAERLEREPAARDWAAPMIARDMERNALRPNRGAEAISMDVLAMRSPDRGVMPDGLGATAGIINPLMAWNQ